MLLTSAGVRNQALRSAFAELLGRAFADASVAYVATAATVQVGPHDWLVEDINLVYALGWRSFNVLDLAALPREIALQRLRDVDAIYVTGGNAYHLAHTVVTGGLADGLCDLLASKVYVGASAGSMIFAQSFTERLIAMYGTDDEIYRHHNGQSVSPFNLFDWWFVPHHDHAASSPPSVDGIQYPVYLLDDDSAVRVVAEQVDVVSSGTWALINGPDGMSRRM